MIVINSPEDLREKLLARKYNEESYKQFLKEIFGFQPFENGYSYENYQFQNSFGS